MNIVCLFLVYARNPFTEGMVSQRQEELHFAATAEAMHDLEALGEGLQLQNFARKSKSDRRYPFDSGFTPDILATFVHSIQSGEFFICSNYFRKFAWPCNLERIVSPCCVKRLNNLLTERVPTANKFQT